jgi:hypothetical protein
MASAKQSALDRLHRRFIQELTDQLEKPDTDPETGAPIRPTAALLAVIGQTLFRSGTKAVDDSPPMNRLRVLAQDLPFVDAESKVN